MAAEIESKTPWYRARTFILGAGALATALVAVVTLWSTLMPRDPRDQARVELLYLGTTTLHDFSFAAGGPGGLNPLEDHLDSTRATLVSISAVAVPASAPDPSPPPAIAPVPADPTSPAPPGGSKLPIDPPAAPPTRPPAVSPAAPPAGPAPVAPPSPSRPTDPPEPGGIRPWSPAGVAADPALEQYRLSSEEVLALHTAPVSLGTPVDPNDPQGGTLTDEEVAARLAEALSEIEATEVNGMLDPHGFRVSVNYYLEGFADESILLTWALNGPTVSADWRADRVGVRIEPTTESDGGSVDLWVPDLSAPGDYIVEVTLVDTSDGIRLTTGSMTVPAHDG